MTIDQKLSELEIKRILIVDDVPEHILAVQSAFAKYTGVQFEYASSAKSAIEKIKTAAEQGQKYDLVISDLTMETETAGLDVVKEAIMHSAYATIATGANYDKSKHDGHGPTTTIIPLKDSIKAKKDEPEVWDFALEKSLEYVESYRKSPEFKAIERYQKQIGIEKMPEQLIEYVMEKYR
ncbi:MAG: hypothetical protein QXK76_03445 [Candidatus Woesearchaeota archaeon]